VLAYAVDVVLGSPLTVLSLIGPNPGLGARFFGMGNELEATVATLIPIGVGAWLAARRTTTPRAAATAFAVAAVVGIVVFAPGRFGADVGAAIVLPIGAAVAAWVMLGGGRRRLVLLLAIPVIALAAVVGIDLVLGGDAHLSRSVLEAGGLDDLADVLERRLRLSAESFTSNLTSPTLLVCAALIVAGLVQRRRVVSWFEGRRAALAGLAGAIAATIVGTLANDSGALLLMIGTGYASLFVAYAWAMRE
jgi:cell division protein FtsW (lipid II flippase)